MADYLRTRLFEPLGMKSAVPEFDAAGTLIGGSLIHATARDWARFGWFVLQGGEGRVDASALRECFTGTRANPGYGLSFWLLRRGLVAPGRNAGVEIDAELSDRFGGIDKAKAKALGYDTTQLRKVPQQWPETAADARR